MTSNVSKNKVLAICGGVGGAKLALGLQSVLVPDNLTVAVNTGDDFVHLGLLICPDLDTVMYTLAGVSNKAQGWGVEGESWALMGALAKLGGETWFRLGDRDLATHLQRTSLLGKGLSLTEVTVELANKLGVKTRLLPMSDQAVRTMVNTDKGRLPFQNYFVEERCEPTVLGFEYRGIDNSTPQQDLLETLADPELDAIIICPSNPFVSIAPILKIPGFCKAIAQCRAPVVAVSPIVGGAAIKGPSAKMMLELGYECSAQQVLKFYQQEYSGLLDGFLIDDTDSIVEMRDMDNGVAISSAQTVMKTIRDKTNLAENVLDFALQLRGSL